MYEPRFLDPRTTEQNIAMQQRLDQATAEELFFFPRKQMLNLKVTEEEFSTSQDTSQMPKKRRSATDMARKQKVASN